MELENEGSRCIFIDPGSQYGKKNNLLSCVGEKRDYWGTLN